VGRATRGRAAQRGAGGGRAAEGRARVLCRPVMFSEARARGLPAVRCAATLSSDEIPCSRPSYGKVIPDLWSAPRAGSYSPVKKSTRPSAPTLRRVAPLRSESAPARWSVLAHPVTRSSRELAPRLGCAFRISAAPLGEGRRNPPARQIHPRYCICRDVRQPGTEFRVVGLALSPAPRSGKNTYPQHLPKAGS
jgi:hypothetical protein